MPDTVTCKSCGKAVAPGDRFCAGCGTAVTLADETVLAPAAQDVDANATQCLRCGAAMGREDRFCPRCGASRPEAATVVSHVSLRNAQATRLIEATKGEFEILEQLGTGAMGAVYLAKDVALGRKVAIKVIAPHLLSDETMVSRFRMEAQTVAALRHPNIVNVHAVRQSEDLHYFVMEFIDGPPLRNVVKQNAPIEVDVVQAILFQVGSALSYAHRSRGGVIHRDVKPANIMVDREGDAFVTDFGISKIAESQSGLTQTGATIGTPEYMSPEQCRGDALTGASDQYALGIVAYEMLCGHTPFSGSQYYVMVAHTSEQPKPIRDVRPDCPAHVAEAVERMLAKAPEDRWPDLDSAVSAMGGVPLGYHDPVRQKIKALTGATLLHVPAVGAGSRSGGASGGRGTLDTATSITVTGLPSVLETGERIQLRADVRGADNTSLGSLGVTWASTDPSIARVDGGWVEGLSAGTVSIMASAGNVARSVLLTVAEPAPARVLVRPAAVQMHRGGKIGLQAEVQDKRGRPLEREIRWLSSDPAIAIVSATGEVTATGSGPVVIRAESEGATGTAEVVVEAPVEAPPSRAQSVSAAPVPAAGAPSGKVASPGPGPAKARPATVKRSAEAGGAQPARRHPALIAAALVVLLGVGIVGVRFVGGGLEQEAAQAQNSSARGADGATGPAGDGALASPDASTGSEEPPEVGASAPQQASAEPTDAATQPRGSQTAEPTSPTTERADPPTSGPPRDDAQAPAAARENVPAPPPTPSRVAVGVPSAVMEVGDTQSATAQVFASGGATMARGSYTLSWRSSDGSVVSVEGGSGVVRAVAAGIAWVVGSAGSVRDSVRVTVAPAVAAVQIAEQDFAVEAGAPARTLSASVLDRAGQRLEQSVTWSSSNARVATVDATGRVAAVAPGTTQITAAAAGFSDEITVSVTEPAPALPSVADTRSAVEGYAAALATRDRDLVTRLWGSGDTGRRDELLELFGQNSFAASLGTVGTPSQAGSAATVRFRVIATWRTNFGQNRERQLDFLARLERNGSTWQLVSSVLQ